MGSQRTSSSAPQRLLQTWSPTETAPSRSPSASPRRPMLTRLHRHTPSPRTRRRSSGASSTTTTTTASPLFPPGTTGHPTSATSRTNSEEPRDEKRCCISKRIQETNRGTHDDINMMYNDDDYHSQFIHPFRCNGRFTCFISYRSDYGLCDSWSKWEI